MPQNPHLELATSEAGRIPAASGAVIDAGALRTSATELSQSLAWLPSTTYSNYFAEHCAAVAESLQPLFPAFKATLEGSPLPDDYRWLHDNLHLIQEELEATSG